MDDNTTTPARTGAAPRRWARRMAWALGGLLALWALSWAAVPLLLKSQVERIASRELGRSVSIGAVDFRPWSLELTVRDLRIGPAAGASSGAPVGTASGDLLSIERLYVDAELQSVLRLAPVLDALEIDAPRLRLTRTGPGRYDIDDLIERVSRPTPDARPGEPTRFALFNLQVRGGEVRFDDRPTGRTHTVSDLTLGVPFLSNLPSQRTVKVQPRLAFMLDGARIDTQADGTPFDTHRAMQARLNVQSLDLAPWLGYVPAALPLQPLAGVLGLDLTVAFEQTDIPRVTLQGKLALDGFSLGDRQRQPLAGWRTLALEVAPSQPLVRQIRLASLVIGAPEVEVRRDAAGRLNWLSALQARATPAAPAGRPVAGPAVTLASAASGPAAGSAAGSAAGAASPAPGWQIALDRLTIEQGSVRWQDAAVRTQARLALEQLGLQAEAIAWPANEPLRASGSARLAQASLSFSASALPDAVTADFNLGGLTLDTLAPYVAEALTQPLAGRVDAQTRVTWRDGGATPGLRVALSRASVADLRLGAPKAPLASWQRLDLRDVEADLDARRLKAGAVALVQPQTRIERAADGSLNLAQWLRSAPAGTGTSAVAPPAPGTAAAPAQPAWAIELGEFSLSQGTIGWRDAAAPRPVVVDVTGLQLSVKQYSSARPRPMPVSLALRVASRDTEAGRLEWRGELGMAPLLVRGAVLAERLPVHAFEPYFGDRLALELLRADAGFRGEVTLEQAAAGLSLRVRGDSVLEEVRAHTLQPSEELLSWKSLNLRGIDLSVAPSMPLRLSVSETVLSDFFARLIISPEGRINLQDLVRSGAAGSATATVAGTAAAGTGTSAAAVPASAAAAAAAASTPAGAAPGADSAPVMAFGPMSLVNGRVKFSDRFIKPNYSADLTELNGLLSAFSSVQGGSGVQMANLELRGRAEGTASLEVLGRLNPLARPLALDIKGRVRELELPPLSPYSVKYAGYGIERGKLSVDVAYLVLPDGQLTAENRIVLNQLSFGDKVEGGGSLPVKLAVALLKDRNGVIDINLPVKGSLNDPQFSIGPIVMKLIVNLVVKAVTAPFSLLAAAFGGGGEEMSVIGFAPGTNRLDTDAQQRLGAVAKAMRDRPALKLTAVGTAGIEQEREAFKRERLGELVQAEKRRALLRAGGSATAVVSVSADEYPALLTEVYKRADMPKPRNLVGMLKTLPVSEMEALLLADIKVTDDAMRQLAVQRAVSVKDRLVAAGIEPERLFLGAPRVMAPEAKWTPRTELSLDTR